MGTLFSYQDTFNVTFPSTLEALLVLSHSPAFLPFVMHQPPLVSQYSDLIQIHSSW